MQTFVEERMRIGIKMVLGGSIIGAFLWLYAGALQQKAMRHGPHVCLYAHMHHLSPLQRGKRLMQELISPLSQPTMINHVRCCADAHLYAIADILTYLDFLAEEKGQTFNEGTFVIEDYTGNLFDFLHSHAGTYRRISSHFGEYRVQHYGLDIPRNKRSTLLFPHRKRHLLFGQLDQHLVFIKPENYGAALSTPTDFIMHTKEYLQYLARRYMRIGFERDDWREERIPGTIMKTWRHFFSLLDS